MQFDLLERMVALPGLAEHAPWAAGEPCRICGAATVAFDSVDFNKFCDEDDCHRFGLSGVLVPYRRCPACSYVYTNFFDDWTTEEFSRFVYNADYRKVDGEYESVRPERLAEGFRVRFGGCEHARILDFGSGAGVFVERLRQAGFENVQAYDPFSSPDPPRGLFDVITCFEVIEHTPDPVGTLATMRGYLAPGGCIIFSQTVQPPDILRVRGSWWYLAPRNGHVSTYAEETLLRLCEPQGMRMYVGSTVYGFADPEPSIYAALALRQTPCVPFLMLRLFAPSQMADRSIAAGADPPVLWHPSRSDGRGEYRWTGAEASTWTAAWEPVEVVEVRVPVVPTPDAPAIGECAVALDGEVQPLAEDRGEWVARFEGRGLDRGTFTLRTPVRGSASEPSGVRGVAIRVAPGPVEGVPRRD